MNTQTPSNVSPLLHGVITETPLDRITTRLFFIFPLSADAIKWLNTIVYRNDNLGLWINYWSGTHVLYGLIWGLANLLISKTLFSPMNLLVVHTVFEAWELWAGGYTANAFEKLTAPEMIDTILDTVFAMIGMWIIASVI